MLVFLFRIKEEKKIIIERKNWIYIFLETTEDKHLYSAAGFKIKFPVKRTSRRGRNHVNEQQVAL